MNETVGADHPSKKTQAPLDALDPLGVERLLSDEERLIRDSVRAFVRGRVLPEIAEWYERGVFPRELAPELGALGVLGMHLTGYGCAGASAVAYGVACRELEAADSGVRSFVSVQGSLAMFAIWRYGSEEQKQAYLPGMAAGELIGCFGLTEPEAGSDPSSMRTTARKLPGGDWAIDGTKMWITNGSIADVALVWARTAEGVRGFLVPARTPGFTARDIHGKLSLRASVTSELVFENCRVPADAVLPGVVGMRGPLSCLNEARFGIVWGAMGAARTCYETALEYARTRRQFGHPIGGFQLTQQKLVEIAIQLGKGTLLALHLGRLKDSGVLQPAQVSIGKLNNVRAALEIARSARSILGANGITLDFAVQRHAANLESVFTYEGTHEIHTLVVGEALVGIGAFR